MADLRFQLSSFRVLISVSISILLLFQVSRCQAQVVEGKIRIDPGPREGLVEVFLDGQWGTISNDNLGGNTPVVICRQQGFNGPVEKVDGTVSRVPSHIPVWIINNCLESASSILDCERTKAESTITDLSEYSFDSETFDHDNDLGIICKDSEDSSPMYLVIDFVVFGLSLVCILLCAFMAYYCATRNKEPKSVDTKGDAGYQSYNKSAAIPSAYTTFNASSGAVKTHSATSGPSQDAEADNGYAAVNSGYVIP